MMAKNYIQRGYALSEIERIENEIKTYMCNKHVDEEVLNKYYDEINELCSLL